MATLTVNPAPVAPTISSQPVGMTVTAGQTATFSVTATGTAPLSYQWQKNSANIAGAPNAASYTTPATTTGDSGATFRVIVSNGVNPPATSNAATLTVNAASVAPTITSQPVGVTVTAGQTATFSVTATGTAPLSYQWQKNSANVAGAPNAASYMTPATTTGHSGATFRVIVSNGVNPPATSNAATLTVNAALLAPSITSQPVGTTVTAGQTATFSVTATGTAPLSYQWQKNNANISGAPNAASYTTPATTTGDSGSTFRVVVSNSVNPPATSNAVTLTVNAAPPPSSVTVLTYHNDIGRTGLNANETILTTGNVNSTKFGKLGSLPVTGLVDAEPLYVPNLTINGGTHNVLFVATEDDMVYAFDADTPAAPLWQVSVVSAGETFSDDRGCGQVTPHIGVTSTPVIDLAAGTHGTIFVVAMSKTGSTYHQRLHALDLTTGADLMAATNIQATASGTGTGSSGGTQTFNPASYEERAALLLLNGVIYTTWTSHCDAPNYTSWVISFTESNLQKLSVLNLTANGTAQNGQEGGIWMAGDGPAADATGNIYFLVGNGTFDTTLSGGFPNKSDFGNSFMKLTASGSSLTVADYFAMNNAQGTAESESSADTDLGSGGAMVLPDLKDNGNVTHHLAFGAGKDSNMYIVDRDNMGKFTSNDTGIYQELSGALAGGVWSAPAYFNNTVFYGSSGNHLLAFPISNAKLATSPSSSSSHAFGYPGTTPSVSANGTANGIVWTLEAGSTGTLRAFDATNLNTELYNSGQAGSRDTFSDNSNDKFVTPMIANGKVYVGSPDAVVVFGLLP
jgi:hypothetical protein